MKSALCSRALSAIMAAADSPKRLRPCDAWRVYDAALMLNSVSDVKEILRKENPAAFNAMCQYEGEEIENALNQTK